MTMLEVKNLTVSYRMEDSKIRACEDVSFTIEEGEIVGLVGESGSGKSTVGKAILQLSDKNAEIESGEILFKGTDLLELPDNDLRELRWDEIVVISQSSMNAFDPVYTVGAQIIEAIREHRNISKKDADERVFELFKRVSLDPERRNDYPHQLSGGMKQRALIAMALALNPSLIIADEPTTGLDVVTQDIIINELEELQDQLSNSLLVISHDIGVIAETVDKISVMYGGEIVEIGPTAEVLRQPFHPYTIGLKNAFPDLRAENDLIWIPGVPPTPSEPPEDCRFAPRCPFATDECTETHPDLAIVTDGHRSRCLHRDEAARMRREGQNKASWEKVEYKG